MRPGLDFVSFMGAGPRVALPFGSRQWSRLLSCEASFVGAARAAPPRGSEFRGAPPHAEVIMWTAHSFRAASVLLGLLTAGCGPGAAAETVRPKEATAATALDESGSAVCQDVKSGGE